MQGASQSLSQGYSSIGRASVSKTEGWGFDSLCPCHLFPEIKILLMADKIKILLALALVGAGLAGFYLLSDQALVVRILCVLGGVAAAAVVGWSSESGQRFVGFAREAVVEVRKVVWPTRKETVQTTGMVFAFVVVIAIFLWLTDLSLEWVLYDIILGWK